MSFNENVTGNKKAGQNLLKNDIAIEDMTRTGWNGLGPRELKSQLPVVLEPHYTLIVLH